MWNVKNGHKTRDWDASGVVQAKEEVSLKQNSGKRDGKGIWEIY